MMCASIVQVQEHLYGRDKANLNWKTGMEK